MPPVREVEPAVGAEEGTVQTGGVGRQRPSGDHHVAPVGHTITIGVLEPEQVGRRGHIECIAIPHGAGGQGEMIGEDLAMIEYAVAVPVLQQPDLVVRVLLHLGVVERVAG